jgi:hypothetical protein
MNVAKAFEDRAAYLKAVAEQGKGIGGFQGSGIGGFQGSGLAPLPGFQGSGFGDWLKKGWKSIKPVAYSALRGAISGFAKGFEGSQGDLGEKALSGLSTGIQEAGKQAITELGKPQTGGAFKQGLPGVGIQTVQKAERKERITRPKIMGT